MKSHAYLQKSREIKSKLAQLEELENKIFSRKNAESEPASRDQSEDESSEKSNYKNDGETKYEKNSSNVGTFGKLIGSCFIETTYIHTKTLEVDESAGKKDIAIIFRVNSSLPFIVQLVSVIAKSLVSMTPARGQRPFS